ncbi:ESX secretion-associated protein EspG [Rhodococcoides yunnanense]|uniref:ESX secretion-associated protein EspG n=1 Tax=Rhodococcoides yunnanense TaxID=278209 RepID=UPI000934E2A6|nr:ESX secretion-associated protein EspG [Rhodococcus yunnanensis]
MSEREWTLAGLEFRILMERSGRDRLPFPLQFRPNVDSAADYHRQRHQANTRATDISDADLRTAFHVIVEPDYRIEMVGHTRTGSGYTKLRAHAAVRHDLGVVLLQQPGVDDATGGDVAVRLVEYHRAPGLVLASLPACGAGRQRRLDVRRPVGDSQNRLLRTATRTTDEEQFELLLGRERSSAGEILVCPGSSVDGRPDDTTIGFQWVDVAGDGRYIVLHGSTVSIVPAAVDELVSEVRRAIDAAGVT